MWKLILFLLAEARLKKNRCANCFDCPSCGHTLSTRASSMPIKAPTEDGTAIKTVTKKLYYLACAFCRWTSRDAGLQDQVTVLGNYTLSIIYYIRIFTRNLCYIVVCHYR